jgi:hypothetical protein
MVADSGRHTADTVWRCEIRKPDQFQARSAREKEPAASPTGRNDSARFSSIALISQPVRARQRGQRLAFQTRLRLHSHVRRRAEAGMGRSPGMRCVAPVLCPWRRRKVARSVNAISSKMSSPVSSAPSRPRCRRKLPGLCAVPLQRVDSALPARSLPADRPWLRWRDGCLGTWHASITTAGSGLEATCCRNQGRRFEAPGICRHCESEARSTRH